ncbi:C-type lectin domain family 4 member M [Labeo rohita]|uniref:C-type lectin domain family 4 member M n=1 Tax=Labeo rohita TaxID=84645 RepID=A0ABQ8MK38_LABRO|nr:C-type lectin domain family 4 member M [Labeo rohita]
MEHRMGKDKNIYVNVNPINSDRAQKENTGRHQTPQHTGSDYVTIRRYRAAVVCLVLLCVLLLMAVIVLCVHIHTNNANYTRESGEQQINITKLTEEKDQLDFVKKISSNAKVWMGLTDIDVEGTWKWVDGSTLTSRFWDPREPNGQRKENCALTYSPGWADYPCYISVPKRKRHLTLRSEDHGLVNVIWICVPADGLGSEGLTL